MPCAAACCYPDANKDRPETGHEQTQTGMASISILSVAAVSVTNMAGAATRNGNTLTNALWGDAFSWEVPDNLKFTFDFSNQTTLNFSDSDGILKDDPYNGDQVADQKLTSPVTIGGQTWTPNSSNTRWQWPAPVTVEDEYHVTLFDAAGKSYTLVAVSITSGYNTQVVGVTFLGEAPPSGTTLYYIQGKSTYNGNPQSPIPNLTVTPPAPPCFLRGTRIGTPDGPRPVQALQAGDLVMTADHGAQPIRWIGSARVAAEGDLAPVRIGAGQMGNDRDLLVSPNHRLLVSGGQAELLFGEEEVLVAAQHLVDGEGVTREPMPQAEYFHILLDRHEILSAEGAPAESLYLGTEALRGLSPEARAEIATVFPTAPWRRALSRPALTGREGRLLRAA